MKAILDDLIFDTATADFVCERDSLQLFKTKKGNFFLFDKEVIEMQRMEEHYAKNFYGRCQNHSMSYFETFGIEPQEG